MVLAKFFLFPSYISTRAPTAASENRAASDNLTSPSPLHLFTTHPVSPQDSGFTREFATRGST